MQNPKATTFAARDMDTVESLIKFTSRKKTSLKPLEIQKGRHDQAKALQSPHGRRRMVSVIDLISPTSQKLGIIPQKYAVVESKSPCGRVSKRSNSIATRRRTSSIVRPRADKTTLTQLQRHTLAVCNNDCEDDNDSDSSGDSGDHRHAQDVADGRHQAHFFTSLIGPTIYKDGDMVIKGSIDRRGLTPHVIFSTAQTPPSEAKNPVTTCTRPVSCGFCSSTNLVWVLRCAFCGCARMSDAPRLQHLINTVLGIDPMIQPEQLAKRILDYAKFDRVALKVEATLKQAGLVRAKTAIMMMHRTVSTLRIQIMRMIFVAWKKAQAINIQQNTNIERIIAIKESQMKRKYRQDVFSVWKGYVSRVSDERLQRFQVAFRRNEATRLRRVLGSWRSLMHIRSKEKAEGKRYFDDEGLCGTPQDESDRLKATQQETLKLAIAAGDSILNLLHVSLRKADHSVQKTLQLVQMYPTTAGQFFKAAHGTELLEALSSGRAMPQVDGFGLDDEKDDATMKQLLNQTIERIDASPPPDSLMQWLNFQRQRGAEMRSMRKATDVKPSNKEADADESSTSEKPPSASSTRSAKLRSKDKKKEFKPIRFLQDLRAVIVSPGVMLKLLCHTSIEAQAEFNKSRNTELPNTATIVAAENSTTATMLSPSAQLQLKLYFKIAPRILNLPPDIVTRESFVLNDFDSLYAYTVYLYLFHPNYVAPGLTLSPRYHLSYSFLTPQWTKVKKSLLENNCDSFAQQRFHIFLGKLKMINLQFLKFIDICKAVQHIASWHERLVTREAFNDFSRRVLCKDSNISVLLEKETLASLVSLSTTKLLSLCENEDELRQIEQVYKDNVLDLIKIFRIYGSAAGGKGILEQEFLKLMTKAGVTNKKNVLRSHLQLIYQQSRQANPLDSSSLPVVGADGEDEPEDRGATPNEFFEALTRVAHHCYQKRRENLTQTATAMNVGDEGSTETLNSSGSLLLCVVDLVTDKIVPLTKKFQEQGLTFKKQMVYPDVQHVCKAQEKKLKRTFSLYSQRNKNPQSRGKLLDLSDFESLLKDRKLIDALFPHGKLKQLVAFVQQDGEAGNAAYGYDTEGEFVFSEFVETLSAIAVYRNANPYIPFAKKLETFFDEYL